MNLSAYVGLPFVEGGRDRLGCDCYGLLRMIYAEQFGIVLPSYSGAYAGVEDRKALEGLIAGDIGPWREIEPGREQPGDGLLMKMAGAESHIGIVVGRGMVLHTERNTGSIIESYRQSRLRRRVAGFFRHEAR